MEFLWGDTACWVQSTLQAFCHNHLFMKKGKQSRINQEWIGGLSFPGNHSVADQLSWIVCHEERAMQILLYSLTAHLLYTFQPSNISRRLQCSKPCQQVWIRKIAKKSPNLDVSSDSCDRVHKEAAVKFARREVAGIGGMNYFRKPIWTLWKATWHLKRCVWW